MNSTRKNAIYAYLLLLPSLLVILFVFLYPVAKNVQYSFSTVVGPVTKYVGLRNYQLLFKNDAFLTVLLNNAKLLLAVPIMIAVSLFVAIFLHEKIKGWKLYRTVLFFPYILAVPIAGIVFGYIYQLNGILNELLRSIGLGALALDWLGNPKLALFSLMSVIIWKEVGFGIVLFLSRMLSIPAELYEAATLDGANWWQRHRDVTIPEVWHIIEFYFTISMITMMSGIFGYVYVMTGGGPGQSTNVTELFIYQTAFRFQNIGMASAVSVVLLAASLVFVFLQLRMRRGEEDAAH
ncbi:carbohydrate ABC transporter permease [Paenibacillus thermotolerans]|uniref:carbohydrate ABC transporter permease n=1 Tax=Paenibacillus thermotolerans TaxID=3027807 RepID=UPI0023681C39|nr:MULTISPECIES: sugar ABC transporter permease [unclassified Paenibacillus]